LECDLDRYRGTIGETSGPEWLLVKWLLVKWLLVMRTALLGPEASSTRSRNDSLRNDSPPTSLSKPLLPIEVQVVRRFPYRKRKSWLSWRQKSPPQ
jgi:hypothetical protein